MVMVILSTKSLQGKTYVCGIVRGSSFSPTGNSSSSGSSDSYVFAMFNRLTVAVLSWQIIQLIRGRISSCLSGSDPVAPLINGDGDGRQHGGGGGCSGGGRLLGRAGREKCFSSDFFQIQGFTNIETSGC